MDENQPLLLQPAVQPFSYATMVKKGVVFGVSYAGTWLAVHYGFTLTPEQEAVIVGLIGSVLTSLRNKLKMAYPGKFGWL